VLLTVLLLGLAGGQHEPARSSSPNDTSREITLWAVEDTYFPDFRHGTGALTPKPFDDEPYLVVDQTDRTPSLKLAVIRFDHAALGGSQVSSATLRLWVELCVKDEYAPAFHVVVQRTTEAWDAASLTGEWVPETGGALGLVVILDAEQTELGHAWVEIDVTSIVRQWAQGEPQHGVLLSPFLESQLPAYCRFSSSEGEKPPHLHVAVGEPHVIWLPISHAVSDS
jgi:hypothetical protein